MVRSPVKIVPVRTNAERPCGIDIHLSTAGIDQPNVSNALQFVLLKLFQHLRHAVVLGKDLNSQKNGVGKVTGNGSG